MGKECALTKIKKRCESAYAISQRLVFNVLLKIGSNNSLQKLIILAGLIPQQSASGRCWQPEHGQKSTKSAHFC